MQNSVSITGRLTRDPELKQVTSGDSVLRFSLACSRDYKDKTTGDYPTDFIDCEVWRQSADFLSRYGAKGCTVQVTGRLQIDDWTDNDGNKRRNAKVLCTNVYIVSSPNKRSDGEGYNQGYTPSGDAGQSQGGNYGGEQQNGSYGASGSQGGYGSGYGGGYTKGQDKHHYSAEQKGSGEEIAYLTEAEEQDLPF